MEGEIKKPACVPACLRVCCVCEIYCAAVHKKFFLKGDGLMTVGLVTFFRFGIRTLFTSSLTTFHRIPPRTHTATHAYRHAHTHAASSPPRRCLCGRQQRMVQSNGWSSLNRFRLSTEIPRLAERRWCWLRCTVSQKEKHSYTDCLLISIDSCRGWILCALSFSFSVCLARSMPWPLPATY